MPKVTIEFNLPEEREEYETYSKAQDMNSALWDFANDVLRPMYKRGIFENRELTEEEAAIVDYIHTQFYRILNERGVEL